MPLSETRVSLPAFCCTKPSPSQVLFFFVWTLRLGKSLLGEPGNLVHWILEPYQLALQYDLPESSTVWCIGSGVTGRPAGDLCIVDPPFAVDDDITDKGGLNPLRAFGRRGTYGFIRAAECRTTGSEEVSPWKHFPER